MPSGAKKRKAAKKKKELEAHINPSSIASQGNEDVKNRSDKGSDSGEVESPASENQPSHSNPFGKGNKEVEESSSSNSGTNQKLGLASETKNGTLQNHSSSSSDDESVDTTKEPEIAPTAASIVNSVTPEVSASEETIGVVESASVENTAIPDMITSEKLSLTAPRDPSSKPNEDRNLHLSAHSKGSESAENFNPESEDQPLIVSRPPVPRRTSWLSCCGLCDVFTSSN
ncbi:uncharacterized protein LOC111433088 isoform X2 [Cucurbita moschata]|uniref:Uncharacterized protein LOC111433088 isoform X2 n=1 Tax=Cucurbita moschata TaxID=3662 RepID=A0A6J1EG81_CUCMO|nr:uncharacterized protein LOC111433088 isoform X2 [Cucurbita moschata]